MKFKLLTLALALISMTALANNNSEDYDIADDEDVVTETKDNLPEASKEVLDELKVECKEFAEQDETAPENLKQYLFDCVNQELDSMGYKMVKNLPPR